MNRKTAPIFGLLILALVTLACSPCGLIGGEATPTSLPEPTDTPPPPPTDTPRPTDTPEPTLAPEVELGEEYRSEEGGYAFHTIPDYTVEEFLGMTNMQETEADPNVGPAIYMMGGADEGDATSEQLYDDFMSDLDVDVEVSDPQEILIDGKSGLMADVSGDEEGQEVAGRVVFIAVSDEQAFTMIGAAPAERWEDEFSALFDAVLASVAFFEPAVEPEPTEEANLGEVNIQWASTATASSEYGDPNWSAAQATGAPDVPECGDYASAWAAEGYDTIEWIELTYDAPVLPTEVNIFQTYNPNQVTKVELRDLEGNYHTIYTGFPADESDTCPFLLHIPVEGVDKQVDGVKITIDQSVLETWNEIDAVELVGVPEHPIMDE